MKKESNGGAINTAGDFGRSAAVLDRCTPDYRSAPESKPLSEREAQVRDQLKKIRRDSLWRDAIRAVITSEDPERFRALIKSLQSQAQDNAEVMKRILGAAYGAVLGLTVESQS